MQALRNLSIQEKMMLVIVLMISMLAAFYFLILKSQLTEIGKLREEQVVVQQEIQTLKAALSRLEVLKKEYIALQAESLQLSVRFPDSFSFASMIVLMQDFFNEQGIELTSFTIGAPAQHENYVSIPIAFPTITEDYLTILDFLYKLENLPREARVDSILISTSGDEVSMSLSVSFFAMSSEAPPKEVTPAVPTGSETQTPEATTTPSQTVTGG